MVGLFEAVFELLNSMLAVEAFCGGVDDVGSVVERSFEIGGGVGLALCECGAVAAMLQVGVEAAEDELFGCVAPKLVERGGGDEPGLGAVVGEGVGAERGVAQFGELALHLLGGAKGVAGGFFGTGDGGSGL